MVIMMTITQSYVLGLPKRELESPAPLMKQWLGHVYGAPKVLLGYDHPPSKGANPVLQEGQGFVLLTGWTRIGGGPKAVPL